MFIYAIIISICILCFIFGVLWFIIGLFRQGKCKIKHNAAIITGVICIIVPVAILLALALFR